MSSASRGGIRRPALALDRGLPVAGDLGVARLPAPRLGQLALGQAPEVVAGLDHHVLGGHAGVGGRRHHDPGGRHRPGRDAGAGDGQRPARLDGVVGVGPRDAARLGAGAVELPQLPPAHAVAEVLLGQPPRAVAPLHVDDGGLGGRRRGGRGRGGGSGRGGRPPRWPSRPTPRPARRRWVRRGRPPGWRPPRGSSSTTTAATGERDACDRATPTVDSGDACAGATGPAAADSEANDPNATITVATRWPARRWMGDDAGKAPRRRPRTCATASATTERGEHRPRRPTGPR